MTKNIKNISVLVAICVVITVLLAVTNAITAPIIEENQNAAANEALLQVMPDGEDFELVSISGLTLPASVSEVYKETSGKGYVIKLVVTAYKPGMQIMCGVSTEGIVTGVVCIELNETKDKDFTKNSYGELFKGKDAAGVDAVDTKAGITISTKAYKSAIKDALNTAIVLGGGEADLRSPEEIFNDNLKSALPDADEFIKQAIADVNYKVDFIYAAKNGAGYVYVVGETFVGIDNEGNVITKDIDADTSDLAKGKAEAAATQTIIDITDLGISENITSVQKTADGNYIMEVNGLGFAYNGDQNHYMQGKNIPIEICVVISSNGTVLNCLTVSNQESDGYGAACGDEAYYSQYVGKTEDTLSDVDAISGATITSAGYRGAVRQCLAAVKILKGGN